MIKNLNDDNFLLYAAKHYVSPHYIQQEFFHDLKRIKYIKKAFYSYREKQILKERLILYHIILLYNVFDTDACTKMLFFKINVVDRPVLKTFLVYLNYMPDIVMGINGDNIYSSDICLDNTIITTLRNI